MKNLCTIVMLAIVSLSFAEDMTQLIPPNCAYPLTKVASYYSYDAANSLFRGSDSSFKPVYYNGNKCNCKGLFVKRGSPSGYIVVHKTLNTDTTIRHTVYIDSTFDAGYDIISPFDKIFKSGTTIPLYSITYYPDKCK